MEYRNRSMVLIQKNLEIDGSSEIRDFRHPEDQFKTLAFR